MDISLVLFERPGDITKDTFALERAKEWNETLA